MITTTVKQQEKIVSGKIRFTVSGGTAYGIDVPARRRAEYDKTQEQDIISRWNGAMSAESLQRSKIQ